MKIKPCPLCNSKPRLDEFMMTISCSKCRLSIVANRLDSSEYLIEKWNERPIGISKNRLKSLLAAEEFCRAARIGIVESGFVGNREYPWFARWMRLSGKSCYDKPKPISKTWYGS